MIAEYERIHEVLGRVGSYAQLLFAGNSSDAAIGQFYQTVNERITAISSDLIFFTLEINRLDDAALEAKLADAALAHYRPWLRDLRVFRPHQLDDQLEKLNHERDLTANSAWKRLFDETVAAMRIDIGRDALTVSDALNKLSDQNRGVREEAGKAIGAAFGERIRLFSLITNTLAKDKEIEDTWRRYRAPTSYRNRSNMVEDAVVQALVTAVPRLVSPPVASLLQDEGEVAGAAEAAALGPQRAAAERRRPADRLAGSRKTGADRIRRIQPGAASVGQQFFDKPWIDARLRPGKSGGAFAHSTVPSVHPYLLLNYHGKTRDVMTLAHELGHGVHQVLAGPQGNLMSHTPLTLARPPACSARC